MSTNLLWSVVLLAPDPALEEEIRINTRALIIVLCFIALVCLIAYIVHKLADKRRYAALQARLAADGKTDGANVLADLANAKNPQMIDDAGIAPAEIDKSRGNIFGENYRPIEK